MIENVIKGLKDAAVWFMDRVKEEHAPRYYDIIQRPMWINLVKDKLQKGLYQQPQDFCEDVRLIWVNCFTYNPVGNAVRAVAEKAEKRFENEWANSGLANERSKRTTAGVAAPKFEPDFGELPPVGGLPRSGAKPAKSGGNAPKKPAALPGPPGNHNRVRRPGQTACCSRLPSA
jgi:hypothetical protein